MKIRDFKDLIVWQKAIDMVKEIYLVTQSFPKDELYGLTSQMRRAAVSVPSNIAEGQARSSTAEFLRFISYSQGSLSELETQIIIAVKLNFISKDLTRVSEDLNIECQKMLKSLEKKLKY